VSDPGRGPLSVALLYDDSLDRHGGVQQYVTMLAWGLARHGHTVTHLVGASRITQLREANVNSLARNVPVRFNGSSGTMPLLSRRPQIERALAAGRFDVAHVQVPYSPFMAERVIRLLDDRTALVGTFHVSSERALPRIGARLLAAATRPSLRRFDAMMSVSVTAQRHAARCFGLHHTRIVPNMIDLAAIQAMASADAPTLAGDPRIVFVGNLVPRKGVATLLAAMPAIVAAHPAARLAVAGDGPLRPALERLARRHRLEHHVRFHGIVSESEKAALLAGADVACFPSLYGESFGIVILEAIAAGAHIVVAAANAGYAETLAGTPQALFGPGDSADLARTILRFREDEGLRQRVRARQRQILDRHDLLNVTARVLGVYRDAIAPRQRQLVRVQEFAPLPVA
jgi:phosphatidylinositol alpha-mannosyltransferase